MSFIHDIYEFKKSFRNIEKFAVEFNQTCLNNGIVPNYCYIYIYILFKCPQSSDPPQTNNLLADTYGRWEVKQWTPSTQL